MTPQHHVTDEFLLDYAAGGVAEPVALLVASHLTFCPECRARARMMEGIGGAMLETIEPAAVEAGSRARVLGLIGEAGPAKAAPTTRPASTLFPRPLAAYISAEPAALPWQPILRGVAQCPLTLHEHGKSSLKAALLRIAGGRAIPHHTHRGLEMLLVLDGSFADETGHYRRGDVQIADESLAHRPVADRERDCICLTVVEGPIRLTGPFARLLNPFLRN